MINIQLSKNANSKEFNLLSAESFIRINKVTLFQEGNYLENWSQIITKLELTVELKYNVYLDQQIKFDDDRIVEIPIIIPFDVNQVHPIFEVYKIINNEKFIIGINPKENHFDKLTFKLIDNLTDEVNYSLHLEIEFLRQKFK